MLLGIRHKYLAWQVDEAITIFGANIEAELKDCKTEGARDFRLRRLLHLNEAKPVSIQALENRLGMRAIFVPSSSGEKIEQVSDVEQSSGG